MRTTILDAEETTDGRIRLWGFSEKIETPVKALLFGQMVKRCNADHYQSDLFHDAQYVNLIEGPMDFWWGTREWGTHIAADEKTAAIIQHQTHCTWYHVTLSCDDGTWYCTFDEKMPSA